MSKASTSLANGPDQELECHPREGRRNRMSATGRNIEGRNGTAIRCTWHPMVRSKSCPNIDGLVLQLRRKPCCCLLVSVSSNTYIFSSVLQSSTLQSDPAGMFMNLYQEGFHLSFPNSILATPLWCHSMDLDLRRRFALLCRDAVLFRNSILGRQDSGRVVNSICLLALESRIVNGQKVNQIIKWRGRIQHSAEFAELAEWAEVKIGSSTPARTAFWSLRRINSSPLLPRHLTSPMIGESTRIPVRWLLPRGRGAVKTHAWKTSWG